MDYTSTDSAVAYVDVLTASFTLKHLERQPLDLNRVPGHLCVKIVSQQSLLSALNLTSANSRYCSLVAAAFSHNPYAKLLRQLLRDYDKTTLLSSLWLPYLFPPSKYCAGYHKSVHLNYWIHKIFMYIRFTHQLIGKNRQLVEKIYKHELALQYMHHRPISILWERQQRLGPKNISLQAVSNDMWQKILEKSSAVVAIRLSRTQSTAIGVLDEYIQSSVAVRVLAQQTSAILPDTNSFAYEERRCNFQKRSLLENGLSIGIYPGYPAISPADQQVLNSLRFRHGHNRHVKQEKIRQMRETLGYGNGLYDVYFVDRRPPRPYHTGIYEEIFFSIYGESLQ